jgi:tetratricopeptide (TPR) repeat protein
MKGRKSQSGHITIDQYNKELDDAMGRVGRGALTITGLTDLTKFPFEGFRKNCSDVKIMLVYLNYVSHTMMTLKFTLILLLVGLFSCGQTGSNHTINPYAKKLNDSAVRMTFQMNDSSYQKAILLLDQATAIDSNYFVAYYNKLIFQSQLKQYDKALVTSNNLIRIRPMAPDLHLTCGELYEKISDTVSAKYNFQTALSLYDSILDTMSVGNRHYDMLFMNKAIDLIMLGEQIQGHELLKQLYDRQTDEDFKDVILSFMNKNRKELLEQIEHPIVSLVTLIKKKQPSDFIYWHNFIGILNLFLGVLLSLFLYIDGSNILSPWYLWALLSLIVGLLILKQVYTSKVLRGSNGLMK